MAQKTRKKSNTPPYNIIAICYDFDKTLSPRNMQEDTIFKEYKIDAKQFWRDVSRVTKNEGYDRTLCYLNKLIFDPRFQNKPLAEKRLAASARKVCFCPGVKRFFPRIDRFVKKEARLAGRAVNLEHYIISGGLKAVLGNMSIRKYFKYSFIHLARWAYALQNEHDGTFPSFEEADDVEGRNEAFMSSAIINVRKEPSDKKDRSVDEKRLSGTAQQNISALLKQLSDIKPDVVVCCGEIPFQTIRQIASQDAAGFKICRAPHPTARAWKSVDGQTHRT